jgi:hypothetical protein
VLDQRYTVSLALFPCLPRLVSFIYLGSSQISSARLSPSTVPNWELSSGLALLFPRGSRRRSPALTAFVQYRDYIIRREATAHGAIVCLTVPGSIGGIDLLRANTRDLYPGEPLAILARDLGFTFSTRLLSFSTPQLCAYCLKMKNKTRVSADINRRPQ